ncbi:MAG: YeeE/YedE thiosulfate transporter family protein [Deltaproteobacteria bacterium]
MLGFPSEWLLGLVGGLMIGGAAAIYLLVNGRIMGASGILGGLVDGSETSTSHERLFFIAGLIGLPAVIAVSRGLPATNASSNLTVLIAAGLLVGLGTRLANGCTSGHGVVGLSRFSRRSLVSVVTFLIAGALTMVIFRTFLGVI